MKHAPTILFSLLATGAAHGQCEILRPATMATVGDELGFSLDAEGDKAIAGAREDGTGDEGSAVVYERLPGSGWTFVQRLSAPDAGSNDHFGQSVAIHGNLAVVGAPDDNEGASNSGSIYIFAESAGVWSFVQKITNPDPTSNARFGWSVATNGVKVAVGAKADDGVVANSGAVYVFRQVGAWIQEAKLKANDAADGAQLGESVDYDGSRIVAGAWQDGGAGTLAGAAYVFRNTAGALWAQEKKLTAGDGMSFDWFGKSVAIDGDAVVVGAYRADVGGSDGPGAAYVFRESGGAWSEEAKLVASDWVGDDENGWSCDIEGDRVVVGSRKNPERGAESGAAYLFERKGGAWSQVAKFATADGVGGDQLGTATALAGNSVFGGAPEQDSASGLVIVWEYGDLACLDAGPPALSLSSGGTQELFLVGGSANAGDLYVVLGSLSGTSPGFFLDGLPIPLNPDVYTSVTISSPNLSVVGGVAFLGAAGQSSATFTIPPGTNPNFAGLVFDHAFLVFDLSMFFIISTSNAASVTLVP